ncbi:hypothetical protein BJ170DRAFT_678865 [Xylariales sp. AK1849]|nr:hypothetical protein BJ170DRAFT_678865 [Xylariales sp. AK1849]
MPVTTVSGIHPQAEIHASRHAQNNASVSSSTANTLPYQRRDAHKPNTRRNEEDLYILTLLTDAVHHSEMSSLRSQYFPRRLLKVDAHITLFHALPGSSLHGIKEDLTALCAHTSPFSLAVRREDVFRMAKGVGINLEEKALRKARGIRTELRERWTEWLSEQDRRAGWRGHYTVCNKEDDAGKVDGCLAYLKGENGQGGWEGSQGMVRGLSLWRYDRGWWRKDGDFGFGGSGTA